MSVTMLTKFVHLGMLAELENKGSLAVVGKGGQAWFVLPLKVCSHRTPELSTISLPENDLLLA